MATIVPGEGYGVVQVDVRVWCLYFFRLAHTGARIKGPLLFTLCDGLREGEAMGDDGDDG